MGSLRLGTALSIARQGLELGIEYGPHSIEALLWVAETIEESVYRSGSLRREPAGLGFSLGNPPLRAGAFSAARLSVDRSPVVPERVRIRAGPVAPWRTGRSITDESPIDLIAGVPIELRADGVLPAVGTEVTVRLELECRAIPPLVWIEFTDTVRSG